MAPVFPSVMQMTVQVVAKIQQMAHLLEIVPKYISWTVPSWEKCLCFWPNFTWSTLQMGPFLFSPDIPCFLKCSCATAQQPFDGSMKSLKSQWRTPIKANYLFCYGWVFSTLTMQSKLKLYCYVLEWFSLLLALWTKTLSRKQWAVGENKFSFSQACFQ